MSIEATTIQQYGEKQLIVMSPKKSLSAAIAVAQAKRYAENQAYLIVRLAEKEAAAMLLADVIPQIIQPLGYQSLLSSLRVLPLTKADLVVRTDIPESGREVVDWVAARPQSRVVIVNDRGVVGLFVNPNRSGKAISFSVGGHFDGLSLLGLHGEVNNSTDPQQTFTQLVEPPICPVCHRQDFAEYQIVEKQYRCKHCDHKQDGPW